MQKLDRLGWTDGFAVRCYGRRIGVRTNVPGLLDALRARLPLGWRPAASPVVETIFSLRLGGTAAQKGPRQYTLLMGRYKLVRSPDLDAVLNFFDQQIEFYVAETAHRRVFIHAGVVGWHGQAILIPGRTLSGKSTLVAALVRAGARYYSDEFAVLDARGRVHPYPRLLSMRETPGALPQRIPVEALGGRVGRTPLPVGLVLMTEYQPGAQWQPQTLSPGHGAIAILNHTISLQTQPELTLTALERVTTHARIWQGPRGEAPALAATLLESLRG
jgi:hypothetical protein